MNLHAAQAFLLRDQRNWRKPHLSWLPATLYLRVIKGRTEPAQIGAGGILSLQG
jgi:hypothetical protein